MPNYSGYPTVQDVQQWQIDAQKKNASYEYIMPHHAEKVYSDFKRLAALDCMKMCGYSNLKLDNKEIEQKAKYACEKSKHDTKAISFTNHEEQFHSVAEATYTEVYAAAQDLFSRKYHVLRDCKHDYEQYGEDSFFARIAPDLEQFIRFRRK
jgi:hypothetical protein